MFFTAISIAIILRISIPRRPVCTHQWTQWSLHHATSLQSPDLWSCFLSQCCNHHPNPDLQVLAAQNDQVSLSCCKSIIYMPGSSTLWVTASLLLSPFQQQGELRTLFYLFFIFFRTLFNRGSNSPRKVDCNLGKPIDVHLSLLHTG